jgi:hypothetical protein
VKLILFLLLQLLVTPLLADEVEITIGDTALTIPSPHGYSPVTLNMFRVNQLLENAVAAQNIRFASFVSDYTLPAIRRGEMPDLTRNLSVQTEKHMASATATKADFDQFKQVMKTQYEEIAGKIEKAAPGMMNKFNQGMADDFKVNPDLKISGMIMLPPHDENDRLLAFSGYVRVTGKTSGGTPTNTLSVVTATCLFAKARIFFLYAYGAGGDLRWTRQVSKDWAAAILAANPSDAATLTKESAAPRHFNWNQVSLAGLIGGIIGGICGLIGYLSRRTKAS